jgi:hypothetical protein
MAEAIMKRLVAGLAVIGFVVVASAATGAGQPSGFTGVWVAVKDAPATLPQAPTATFGPRFEFRRASPQRIVLVRPVRDFSVATEYPLDDSQVRARIPGPQCMADATLPSSMTTDGTTLTYRVIGNRVTEAGVPASIPYTFRMTGPGTLEVESTTSVPNETTPRKVAYVYKRTDEAMPPLAMPKATPVAASIADVSWIAGTWATGGATSTIEERWTPPAGGVMLALSRTVRGTTMSAFEFLCIAERHGGLVYTAMPNARTPATDFTMTAFDATSATFENPSHDFPKKIRYVKTADGMEATISGDAGQRATTFTFKKQ